MLHQLRKATAAPQSNNAFLGKTMKVVPLEPEGSQVQSWKWGKERSSMEL